MSNERKRFAETYGGIVGAAMPMVAMLGGILVLAAMGMRSTKNFWSAGYLAVLVGFLVYKDKKEFQKALIDGIRDKYICFYDCLFLIGRSYVKNSDSISSGRWSVIPDVKNQYVTGIYADRMLCYLCGSFQCDGKCGRSYEYGSTSDDSTCRRHGM